VSRAAGAAADIARLEHYRYTWRDAAELAQPLIPFWVMFAVTSLCAGSLWRWLPGAEPPSIYALLNACGIGLWVAGWPLARGMQRMSARCLRHVTLQESAAARTYFSALALLGTAVLCALSFAAVLLPYRPATVLQDLSTQDVPAIVVRTGTLIVCSLLIGGPTILLLSAAIARLLQRLGQSAGRLIWLCVGLYFNLSIVAGIGERLPQFEVGRQTALPLFPPGLGMLANSVMRELANEDYRFLYFKDLFDATLGLGLLALALTLALALFALQQRVPADHLRESVLLLASITAVGSAAAYALGQAWLYHNAVGPRWPGDWHTVFLIGSATLLLLLFTFAPVRDLAVSHTLGMLLLVDLGWITATASAIYADQVSQLQVLQFALVLYPLLLLGVAVTHRAALLHPALRGLLLSALLLPLLPLRDGAVPLSQLLEWAVEPQHYFVSGGLLILVGLLAVRLLRGQPTSVGL
jgi:hypothetical protein